MEQAVDIIGAWSDDWRNDAVILHLEQTETDGTVSKIEHTYRKSDPYGGEFADYLTGLFESGDLIPASLSDMPVEQEPEPEPPVTVIPAVTLWERMTDEEAEQVESVMLTQPFRIRQIFTTAQTFRSDHELWSLLVNISTTLFGEERTKELLSD